jgi:hypothetical protein
MWTYVLNASSCLLDAFALVKRQCLSNGPTTTANEKTPHTMTSDTKRTCETTGGPLTGAVGGARCGRRRVDGAGAGGAAGGGGGEEGRRGGGDGGMGGWVDG